MHVLSKSAAEYSRLIEWRFLNVHSAKFSEVAVDKDQLIKDTQGVLEFVTMRAYCESGFIH